MGRSRFSGVVSLSLALVLGGCDAEVTDDEGVIVTDSAGVALVVSPGTDHALPWRIQEVRRIGGADSGWASFSYAGPRVVGTDTLGRIYLLDTEAFRVVVFDTAGGLVRLMGRKGGGPGELQFPGIMWVGAGGTVEVGDYVKRALVRFSPDGDVLPQISLRGGFPEGAMLRVGPDTAAMILGQTDQQSRTLRALVSTPTDTLVLSTLTAPTPGMVDLGCMGLNMPRLFTQELRLAGYGMTLAVTAQVPYQVDLFQGGRLARSLRRDILPVVPDQASVQRLYPEGMRMRSSRGACVTPASELYEKLGVAAHLPLIRSLAMAPDATLWVERYTFADEPARVDVFDPEGAYRGTLTGHGIPLGFSGDLVLFEVRDPDSGGSQVGIFRITK